MYPGPCHRTARRRAGYQCPAGERLRWRQTTEEKGLRTHSYWSNACGNCALRAQCTTGKERRVRRWEHEEVLERLQARLDRKPQQMTVRRRTIEHVFGTLKHWMASTHFLTKRLENVSTEMPARARIQPQTRDSDLGNAQDDRRDEAGGRLRPIYRDSSR